MKKATLKAGVIGWPVAHSLSPRLHGFWLESLGIDGSYDAIAVEPEALAKKLAGLVDDGFSGFNVTVPHKESVMDHLDEISDGAKKIGAVNTIIVDDRGRLCGSNTDGYGFIENLKAGAPDFSAANGPAVVLGAGGAARAVIAALIDGGATAIRLVNRTRQRAEVLANHIGGPIDVVDWDDRNDSLNNASLLINTTTLGMTGKPPLRLSLDALPKEALVNDIVYSPLETDLLKAAKTRGNRTVDGLGMLLHQARPGFAAWFGIEPQVTGDLRRHVLAGMGA